MNLGLTNKVAMIAGASRGLGYAVARALAEEAPCAGSLLVRRMTFQDFGNNKT